MVTQEVTPFNGFRKRSGMTVPFRRHKIETAITRAAEAVARKDEREADRSLAPRIADLVLEQLDNPLCEYYVHPGSDGQRTPDIEDVQDLVEIILAEEGQAYVVAAYKRYRKQREVARRSIQVRGDVEDSVDITDQSLLLVESGSNNVTLPWNRSRIINQLLDRTDLSSEVAISIAKVVENQVIASQMKTVNTTLIRELVNNELSQRGQSEQLRDFSLYRVPRDFIERLMFSKSNENSNIVSNNPEAVNLGLAELVLKQWGLDTIFSADVKRAHDTGAIHLHDLGYPHRVYCSSHSIEYIKKYGLKDLSNLNTESKPARSASVLTGHLNTFLASMQANYAGALGIAYINILYAPYLEGMSQRELKQVAQELIFNGSQNAFSRGGQTLFLDFNIHTGVPRYLKPVPAIGPGGHYMMRLSSGEKVELEEQLRDDTDGQGNRLMNLYYREADGSDRLVLREIHLGDKGTVHDPSIQDELKERGEGIVTYGDYTDEAQRFTSALLEVWSDGDRNGTRAYTLPGPASAPVQTGVVQTTNHATVAASQRVRVSLAIARARINRNTRCSGRIGSDGGDAACPGMSPATPPTPRRSVGGAGARPLCRTRPPQQVCRRRLPRMSWAPRRACASPRAAANYTPRPVRSVTPARQSRSLASMTRNTLMSCATRSDTYTVPSRTATPLGSPTAPAPNFSRRLP